MILTVGEIQSGPVTRTSTRVDWLDAMLGGGIVAGSVILVYGGPGSGKSTAMLQAADGVAGSLYVPLEEDVSVVADRARRLGLRDTLAVLAESRIDAALQLAATAPLVVIDSLQMTDDIIETVKAVVTHARRHAACVALVCHETKSGVFAGARTIEHLVDVAMRIDRGPPRHVAVEKNRFGPAPVWLPLEMTGKGLICVN